MKTASDVQAELKAEFPHREITIEERSAGFTIRFYDREGNLLLKSQYSDGKKNGMEYVYQDGKVWFATPFTDGKENGIERVYNKDGSLYRETTFELGVKIKDNYRKDI